MRELEKLNLYSSEEALKRTDALVRLALNTPPKRQDALKLKLARGK